MPFFGELPSSDLKSVSSWKIEVYWALFKLFRIRANPDESLFYSYKMLFLSNRRMIIPRVSYEILFYLFSLRRCMSSRCFRFLYLYCQSNNVGYLHCLSTDKIHTENILLEYRPIFTEKDWAVRLLMIYARDHSYSHQTSHEIDQLIWIIFLAHAVRKMSLLKKE